MINLAVLSLIRTTTPSGLWFNPYGVAQRVLRYSVRQKKFSYSIDLICINGLWGGSTHYNYNLGGSSGPVGERDCKYLDVNLCIEELLCRIRRGLNSAIGSVNIQAPKLEDFEEYEPYNLPF